MSSAVAVFVVLIIVAPSVFSLLHCEVRFSENSDGVGVAKESFENVSYCEYLGVRYGRAGRFEDPEVYVPEGNEDYTRLGSVCPQLNDFSLPTAVDGSEDCLFMNIYSPLEVDTSNGNNKLLPVLVFIHGGSFTIGSSTFDIGGVDLLMDKQILVISIDYRLDMLGFLRSPELNITGNYGLKDQLVALRWISQYIQYFGGNPEKVTLMGHSAGAASVAFHLYSEQSRGLFQQATLLSGSFLAPWSFSYNPEFCSERYLSSLGVPTRDDLLTRNLSDLFFLNSTRTEMAFSFMNMLNPCFLPTKELTVEPNPFFTSYPHDLVIQKYPHDIPLLLGHTLHEFELLIDKVDDLDTGNMNVPNRQNITLEHLIKNAINKLANFSVHHGKARSKADFIRKMATVALASFPFHYFWEQIANSNLSSSVYAYRFDFDGSFGKYKNVNFKSGLKISRYGAIHGDDLSYIFTPYKIEDALRDPGGFSEEWKVYREMSDMVANFVKNGNPSINGIQWTPYCQKDGRNFMKIDRTFELETEDLVDPFYYNFWKKIYDCYYYFTCSEISNIV